MTEQTDGQLTLPLRWLIPQDLISRPATNLTIQLTQHEVTLQFFEAVPPVLVGTDEEVKAQAAQIQAVPAVCVARIVISASRLAEFTQLMQDNFQRYKESFGNGGE